MQEYNLTPEQEDAHVEQQFRDLLDGYLASNHRKKVDIIERAFRFAKEAHKGVRRRSGEPYIIHPIAVAKIASQEIGLGSTSICAAFLHDVVEDTDYTKEDIEAVYVLTPNSVHAPVSIAAMEASSGSSDIRVVGRLC